MFQLQYNSLRRICSAATAVTLVLVASAQPIGIAPDSDGVVSAGPAKAFGAGERTTPPADPRRFCGDSFGTIACPDGQWGQIQGCLIDDVCGTVCQIDGFMTECIPVGLVASERRWGFVYAELFYVDRNGLRRVAAHLKGRWELTSEDCGVMWGSVRPRDPSDLTQIGAFFGQFRMHDFVDDPKPDRVRKPRTAQERRGPPPPAALLPPVRGAGDPRRAGERELQTNGCFRLYWEVWD